ncbi:MAG: RagB/SusD family nutrient uptake outer membrane protein [Prevotella sp.]|nr:RagB/SusD family nutrient uptake outer membrane protein [Prevotella sp.]
MIAIYNKVKMLGVVALTALALTACDDYLVTESQSSLSTDNAYSAAANIDQNLTGVYGALKPFAQYYLAMSEFRSDNLFITTEQKTNDYSDCAQFNNTGLLNDNTVSNCWADHYTLIAAANVLLDRMSGAGMTEAQVKQYTAEARFLRALSYFDLVRFFGRVPVSLHELSPSEAFAIPQSEPLEVYNQVIVPDLEYAIENLAETPVDYQGNEHSERVKNIAAKALLGKVYMQMAGYPLYQDTKDKAQALFAEVLTKLDNYWVSSMDSWNRMWVHENDNKNFIFEIQYVAEKGQGNPATPLSKPSNTYADDYCNAYLTTGPHVYVERDLQDHFLLSNTIENADGTTTEEYIDQRLVGTINTGQAYDEETGQYIGGATDQNNFLVKFFEHKIKRASLGLTNMDAEIVDRTCWPQNWPVLRIEDIMLLYAECVGNTTEGYNYLNKIRTRAGLSELKELSAENYQKAVAYERRCELLGEGHRWFDEVRQNTFVEDIRTMMVNYRDKRDQAHSSNYTIYANRVTQNSALYPIPMSQIRIREGLYTQNPGY